MREAKERLCVALDFAERAELLACARDLAREVGWLKIGLEAFVSRAAGLHGVVTSPHEIETIRIECGPAFFVVVPGIRPAGAAAGDQKRTATPAEAIRAGADLLVVGRPITRASDRAAAARAV